MYVGNWKKVWNCENYVENGKGEKRGKVKKQSTEDEKYNYCLYVSSPCLHIQKTTSKKRFVLMIDLEDLYHMVLLNRAEK